MIAILKPAVKALREKGVTNKKMPKFKFELKRILKFETIRKNGLFSYPFFFKLKFSQKVLCIALPHLVPC